MTKQKRNTILLFLVLGLLVLGGFMIKSIFFSKEGAKAIITQNGKVIEELSLSKPVTKTIEDGNGGINTFVIKDNAIYMSEANCPDLVCVYTNAISHTGEVIACLPHGLIITISENDSDGLQLDSSTW